MLTFTLILDFPTTFLRTDQVVQRRVSKVGGPSSGNGNFGNKRKFDGETNGRDGESARGGGGDRGGDNKRPRGGPSDGKNRQYRDRKGDGAGDKESKPSSAPAGDRASKGGEQSEEKKQLGVLIGKKRRERKDKGGR